ncbi:MAG: double-strand break repair protein AddB [Rhizobiaceae bacterium]|nr:double-strand break repair protein AddB [Rhizobiaceae bacterium]MCV0404707.1 double-strand break repair protein AddB [Rhizobiaceae bacterium]
MSGVGRMPHVISISAGAPFLPTLVDALYDGRLIPGWRPGDDPLATSAVTIYLPTRRAARALRGLLVERAGGRAAILPSIRPLGDFEEDATFFEAQDGATLDLAPAIPGVDRLLLLAPLIKLWKSRLPAHLRAFYAEDLVVPSSTADAIWFARDLAHLMDEIETEGSDWSKLTDLVKGDLAHWWQVTLDFLRIVTEHWPTILEARCRSSPAEHRNALISAEAARLERSPPDGPVVAAGSTGSIPATARLLATISRLPNGVIVVPGLDRALDADSWTRIGAMETGPSSFGHPQAALKRLLSTIGVERADVAEIVAPSERLVQRGLLLGRALRPAEMTDTWVAEQAEIREAVRKGALDGVSIVEAANEREEACAIALALRRTIEAPGQTAALATGDRELARRVTMELLRFGIRADDSGGTPLERTPSATLLRLIVKTVIDPGDPVAIVSLLKHPLLRLGMPRAVVREACALIELATLRGGTGRPNVIDLPELFETSLVADSGPRRPQWLDGLTPARIESCRAVTIALSTALTPLAAIRSGPGLPIRELVRRSVEALECCGRDENGSLEALYADEAGQALIAFLRSLLAADAELDVEPAEWPDVLFALMAGEMVKPEAGADPRVHVWGLLEARLQSVDMLVIGGLNEGSFPARTPGDRFLSRGMKAEMSLEPPERRIGQAAHDFVMAMGHDQVVLTRSVRAGDAPAVQSRWLQRLVTCIGDEAAKPMRDRGEQLIDLARHIDEAPDIDFARRPRPTPPLGARPTHFSVTQIETLRRDPYAIYARKILKLEALEPLLRDPAASDRGLLFHDILHRFSGRVADPFADEALDVLLRTGRECFEAADLPPDIETVWWPRFERLAPSILNWERHQRPPGVAIRLAEASADAVQVGRTGVTLSGRADRIDLRPAGMADILDYKTGPTPSKRQAHTLVSPQLALEGALLRRGAFTKAGKCEPAELAHVRLKANGEVVEESILETRGSVRSAPDLSEEAWSRLEQLLKRYHDPSFGYLSRALPFREGDTDGDYDHLARVLEWSAGADDAEPGE